MRAKDFLEVCFMFKHLRLRSSFLDWLGPSVNAGEAFVLVLGGTGGFAARLDHVMSLNLRLF